jgi:hypothetical protein
MTSKRAFACAVALAIGTAGAMTTTFTPSVAWAQSDEELKQARELFQEAFKDEQAGRFDVALEKFKRVARVKESASVRYRIASCMEGLRHYREARDTYRSLAASKDSLPQKDQPIAESAANKVVELDRKIPKVIVTISGETPPADARVTIDGASAPAGRPIEADPGEHVIQATAPGMKPFEQRVTLPDNGSQIPATVAFEKADDHPPPPPPPPPGSSHTTAWIAIGAGGVLLVTGVALLVVREGKISTIKDDCPNNVCPTSKQTEVNDAKDSANLFMPLGIGFTLVGAAAAGFGVYLLVKKSPPPSDPNAAPATGAAGIQVGPRFVRGGGGLGMTASF